MKAALPIHSWWSFSLLLVVAGSLFILIAPRPIVPVAEGASCNWVRCGNQCIDPAIYGCCNGAVYVLATHACCGDKVIYDPVTEACCLDKKYTPYDANGDPYEGCCIAMDMMSSVIYDAQTECCNCGKKETGCACPPVTP